MSHKGLMQAGFSAVPAVFLVKSKTLLVYVALLYALSILRSVPNLEATS